MTVDPNIETAAIAEWERDNGSIPWANCSPEGKDEYRRRVFRIVSNYLIAVYGRAKAMPLPAPPEQTP